MNHGWFIGICTGIVLLFGCGKSQGKWESFPIEIYSDPALISSPQAQADLQEAMTFWEERAGRKLFNYRGTWTGGSPFEGTPGNLKGVVANVIFFQYPWPFNEDVAGQTTVFKIEEAIQAGIIMINPNVSFCTQDCNGKTNQTSERNTFTHELGHFIGLNHSADADNIMYPTVLSVGSLDEATIDPAALRRAVGSVVATTKLKKSVRVSGAAVTAKK